MKEEQGIYVIIQGMQPANIDNQQIKILKKMSSSERLNLAFNLYDFARQRVESEIKHQNPNLNNNEVNILINKRFSR